jgi:hypothetical protein
LKVEKKRGLNPKEKLARASIERQRESAVRRFLRTPIESPIQPYNSQLLHHDLPALSPPRNEFAPNTSALSPRFHLINHQIRRSQLSDKLPFRTIIISNSTLHYTPRRLTHRPWRKTVWK